MIGEKTRNGDASGAPDTVWCPGRAPHQLAALGFSLETLVIIHRTVRCAPDMSGVPME
jgi:hypothetical protein